MNEILTTEKTETKTCFSLRRKAAAAGVLYILGTVAGVFGMTITKPYFSDPNYLERVSENAGPIIFGSLLTLMMGLVLAMIPILLYPILRKQNETLAMGYVVFRGALETTTYIVTTILWLLSASVGRVAVTGGSGEAAFQALGTALTDPRVTGTVTTIFFVGGALMFYSLLFRSSLVPRWISGWGLIATAPYIASSMLVLFSLIPSNSAIETGLYLPMAVQEMVLAVWLIVKGFNTAEVSALTGEVNG